MRSTLGNKELMVVQEIVVNQRLLSCREVHRFSPKTQEDNRDPAFSQSDVIDLIGFVPFSNSGMNRRSTESSFSSMHRLPTIWTVAMCGIILSVIIGF